MTADAGESAGASAAPADAPARVPGDLRSFLVRLQQQLIRVEREVESLEARLNLVRRVTASLRAEAAAFVPTATATARRPAGESDRGQQPSHEPVIAPAPAASLDAGLEELRRQIASIATAVSEIEAPRSKQEHPLAEPQRQEPQR